MKKFHFILLFLPLLSCSDPENKTPVDCEDFKSGEFTYARKYTFDGKELEFEYNLDTVRFTRKDNLQIEYYPETNQSEICEINWLGNCSYELVVLKPAFDIYKPGDRITTRIISRTDSSYTFVTQSKIGEVKGNIIKLK